MEKILISNGKPLIQNGAVLVYNRDNEAFQIPTVSNIKLSDKGILTFDVVDASNFEQFVPSVKYLIDVNGNTITTETNEYYVRPYLLDGENKISISTIMTLTHSDGRKSYHFSKPAAELFTLDVQLTYGLSNFGITSLNNKAYIFGGVYTASGSTTNSIIEFDADTKTIKNLSSVNINPVRLPAPIYGISAIAFNDKIYLFGGYDKSTNDKLNTIMEFDPIAKGLTTLDATIYATANAHCFVINDKIYMFEFSYNTGDWLEFDPNTKTRIYLTDRRYTYETLPFPDSIIYSAMFNNKIYLFPVAYSYIPNFVLEYDFENNIYTRIDLQFDFRNSTMINVLGCAYILKGNEIYMFDGKQIKLIDGSLLQSINSKLGCAVIGDKAYIFGGGTENKNIYELTY